ncbi:MAG: class I SAM-dependent methyltransferase, partial [Pseudomonadales bacterium]|nr:class I SAM-dependent methyltransferase [Pseudomonadales bacterium]
MKTDALHGLFRSTPKSRPRALPFSGRLVHKHLGKMQEGKLILVDKDTSTSFGDPAADDVVHIFINRPDAYHKIAAGGAIGAAEAFMDGDWTTDDLTLLIRILLRNRQVLDSVQANFSRLRNLSYRLYHRMRRDSIRGSRRNIHAHYDLGNDFFRLFLDPTLSYSAGIFQSARDTMERASIRKIDTLCRKLNLGPDDHLLEIGTGWGALAIHAATRYGCKVTTTTI